MNRRPFIVTLALIASLLCIAATTTTPANCPTTGTATCTTSTVTATNSGCLSPPKINSTLPADASSSDQADMNCFAWQEFIALNWASSTTTSGQPSTASASTFGEPNDTTPKVWETYMEASDLFPANGATPPTWNCGTGQVGCTTNNLKMAQNAKIVRTAKPTKHLAMKSKFDTSTSLDLSDFTEAKTGGSWLTAQSGILTLYELRANQDEYNYIYQNGLYNASTQQTFVQTSIIDLPDGTPAYSKYGSTGSIEIKAAWIELDDSTLWPYFKTSEAWVTYPSNPNSPKLATVGLVGLHIIHKTALGQQFIWATFEHVNNCPSTSDIQNNCFLPWYTYYNLDCDPSTDYYQCACNKQPIPGTDPYSAPVQVVRMNPIDTSVGVNNIAGLNAYVWQKIASSNPDSVFLNYQLVNVLWPLNNTPISKPATIPLTAGNPQPSPEVVANTTLETYFQTSATCLDCHVSAPIASTGATAAIKVQKTQNVAANPTDKPRTTAATATSASDYSFLFQTAQSPSAAALKKAEDKKKKTK